MTVLGSGTSYEATIRWTDGLVPNITGDSLADVTFGQGWSSGATRPCDLVDMIIKLRGERSKYFGRGADDANVTSDLGWRAIGIDGIAEQDWPQVSAPLRESMVAFAAGWNAQLAEVGSEGLAGWCAGEAWIRPVEPEEIYLYARGIALFASSSQVVDYVAGAEPPSTIAPAALEGTVPVDPSLSFEPRSGSNGWAIGSERTATGGGGLLLNPHLTWDGELRWSEVHLTVPGELDIYGAQLAGIPGIGMGFTETFGWAHTTALGNRFTFYTLDLVPGSPTSYRYGDEVRKMTSERITIDVRGDDGTLRPETHTRWRSHYGPILDIPGLLPWTDAQAISIRDANIDNEEFAEQYQAMTGAKDLDDFISIQERYQGQPVFNTLAASADGRTWLGDLAATPNLSPTAERLYRGLLESDPLVAEAHNRRVALLDGSDPRFEWQDAPGARDPGLVPVDEMPAAERRDYLFNANDASWFSNVEHPLVGDYSVLHGVTDVEQSPRSRQNAATLEDASTTGPAGADGKFTLDELATAALDNRSFTAVELKDAVVARCTGAEPQAVPAVPQGGDSTGFPAESVDLTEACAVLAEWDGAYDLDSEGALLWREFSNQGGIKWAEAFDAADPLHTPSGLAAAPATGDDPALVSLARSVQTLRLAGYSVDVPLKQVQIAVRNGTTVPVPGGNEGVTNVVGGGGVPAPTSLDPSGHRIDAAGFAPQSGLRNVTGAATFTGYPISGGSSFMLALVYGPEVRRPRPCSPTATRRTRPTPSSWMPRSASPPNAGAPCTSPPNRSAPPPSRRRSSVADRRRLVSAFCAMVTAISGCSGSSAGESIAPTASTISSTSSSVPATTTTLPPPLVDQTPPQQVNGLAVDGDGVWVADFRSDLLLFVDRSTGGILRRVPTMEDRADDVAVGPDGSAWTTGVVSGGLGRTVGNTYTRFAMVQGGINGIEFAPDGTLYVATGGTLFELEPGGTKPEAIVEGLPDINGFGVLPDGRILAPGGGFRGPGQAVLIDPKARTWEAIVTDLPGVAAGTTDPDGVPYLLSNITGELFRIDLDGGTATVVRTIDQGRPFDNLSFADDGTLYLSSFFTSTLTQVAPDGTTRSITIGT